MTLDEPDEAISQLEQRATILWRRLTVLNEQVAHFGAYVPPHIVLEQQATLRELNQIRAHLRQLRGGIAVPHSPYRGLLPFTEEDHAFFFGREHLIAELVDKVRHTPFLAVLGPSGSGKSSLVRAGLIPALKADAISGSAHWPIVTFKPGGRPFNALAAALTQLQGGSFVDMERVCTILQQRSDALLLVADSLCAGREGARCVVVVDQAEELWTLVPSVADQPAAFIDQQQRLFLDRLLSTTTAPDCPMLIVLVLRADFLHRALEHPDLPRLIGAHALMVGPMTATELQRAIVRPAELTDSAFESGLVKELIAQTLDRPGALPLLAHTLFELWAARPPDGSMTWATFQMLGGVAGGVAQRAETLLATDYAIEQHQELRAILLRLVQLGDDSTTTRRRVRLEDLVLHGHTALAVRALLKPLIDARLLMTSQDDQQQATIEIAHEALIQSWPSLQRWISCRAYGPTTASPIGRGSGRVGASRPRCEFPGAGGAVGTVRIVGTGIRPGHEPGRAILSRC